MREEMAIAGTPTLLQESLKHTPHGNPDGLSKQYSKRKLLLFFVWNGIPGNIKGTITFILLIFLTLDSSAQVRINPARGYSNRIRMYIDTLKIVDSHEHFFDPELIRNSTLTDFMMLLQHYSFSDFVSAGINPKLWQTLVGDSLSINQKWSIIEPYWNDSFNTGFNRVARIAADRLYGIDNINANTIELLSEKIKNSYQSDWFRKIISDKCNIESLILDGNPFEVEGMKIYHVQRFTPWLTVRTKFTVDSISIRDVIPIRTLEDFVKSMEASVVKAKKGGAVAIKINIAYSRPLNFEDVKIDAAIKIFRAIMDSEEESKRTYSETKPLHDYMIFRLLELAEKYELPVAFHTGLMAGTRNSIEYADPTLLTNLFQKYPDTKFVLLHGSYPYGGELATLVKNFSNVYMDLSWIYAISPTYSERYLNEWIEAVPASKIMAFGGDYASCESTFGELIIAKQVITKVLTDKVRSGYFSEEEAKRVAKMILYDSSVRFYDLK